MKIQLPFFKNSLLFLVVSFAFLANVNQTTAQCTTAIPITGTITFGSTRVPTGWTIISSPDGSSLTNWLSFPHYVNGSAVASVATPPDGSTTFLTAYEDGEAATAPFTVTTAGVNLTVYLGGFSTSGATGGAPTGFTVDAQDVHITLGGVRINGTGTVLNDGNWHPITFSNLAAGSYVIRHEPSLGATSGNNMVSLYVGPDSLCPGCGAGTTAPPLSATTLTNVCNSTTADLDALHTGTIPTGATIVWSTDNDSSDGLSSTVATPTAVAVAGTYYAYYHHAVDACYSPVSTGVVFTLTDCCDAGTEAPKF